MSFMPANYKITRYSNKKIVTRCQLDDCIPRPVATGEYQPILRSLNFENLKCLEVEMCDMIIVGIREVGGGYNRMITLPQKENKAPQLFLSIHFW